MWSTPVPTRVYRNHHLDSSLWEGYVPRDDDIVVLSSYKSGTTWMRGILTALLKGAAADLDEATAWIDCGLNGFTPSGLRTFLAGLRGRRVLKSHLPGDGMPYYRNVRYVLVARDPRDVFMSLFNHYANYTPEMLARLNGPGRVGAPLPPCPERPRAFWRSWITQGFFEGESEGWPFWANMGHTRSFWPFRRLPNVLFVHYADMLADTAGTAGTVAAYADIPADEADIARVADETGFARVRRRAEATPPHADGLRRVFRDGARTFFFRGTNGRWREVLEPDDLVLYEQARKRTLGAGCARWLEQGGDARAFPD